MGTKIDTGLLASAAARAIDTRRDIHKHAELGLTEFRTASLVAKRLKEYGLSVTLGKAIMAEDKVYGRPPDEVIKESYRRARDEGADPDLLKAMEGGYTGVVGVLDSGRPGPVVALRADMDALPILEDDGQDHFPESSGFRSIHPGVMHACGHDVHTAVALAVAEIVSKAKDQVNGKIKFLFQPAEEGGRGALPMAESGVVDDVDYLIAIHVGTGVPSGTICPAVYGHLASMKWDVTLKGRAAHAGARPEEGRNALLAAAEAVIGLYGIARHHKGRSRVNVGILQAGSGRNVIADSASLAMELRGESDEILDYMAERARAIIEGAAMAQGVQSHIEVVGKTTTASSDASLAKRIADSARGTENVKIQLDPYQTGGSEDATFFMRRVQERGGSAVYCAIGSDLPSGHHTPRFDIQERDIAPAISTLSAALMDLGRTPSQATRRQP